MKCSQCEFENRDGVKFCEECGADMKVQCAHCGEKIPAESKFCGECGHQLAESPAPTPKDLTFEEKLAKIQTYLPQGLAEKILSQREKIEGERKQVTILFCDLEGFTPLVEKIGAEEAYVIMDQVYEILIHCVRDFEGTVNEMTGDGIMALFGAPIALEDAPQRAIRSALSIHREMARFNDRLRQEQKIPPLRMRIGIHSGPVVVGTLGNDLRVEFKAVGDTVNLASRMESMAEPGSTYVTEDLFKMTEGFFRFEALGEKSVKGKEQAIGVFRVITTRSRRTRFDVSAERGLTPLVGRERELTGLMDGFRLAKSGKGQALSVVAEAGSGKSRLIYEFRKKISNEDITILEGKCISYNRNVAYYPIIDILKANFNIEDDEAADDIRKKLVSGLQRLEIDAISPLPVLLELFSVRENDNKHPNMNPEVIKSQITEIVLKIVHQGSSIRPLVLIYEDLHWIDKSAEELLGLLLEIVPGARILLIFTFRPEYTEIWGRKSYHQQINLNRFSKRESLKMLVNLLKTEAIEIKLEELVLEKTDGNPFFIEEFIHSLIDLKIIKQQGDRYFLLENIPMAAIPASISDVIMARVDSLPDKAREILQIGSVIEREFGFRLIRHITGFTDPDLKSVFADIKDTELLYEQGILPENSFVFNHALTRQVIYDTILPTRKQKLHKQVGTAIEALYPEDIQKYYEILGEHFSLCGDIKKGDNYLKKACRKAEKTAALDIALNLGRKRVMYLEKQPLTEHVQTKIIDARSALGLYYIQFNLHTEAKEAVESIINPAKTQNYKKRLAQIYTIMGSYYMFVEEDINQAKENAEESINISIEIKNFATLYFAYYWAAVTFSYNCKFEKASICMNKTIEIAAAKNDLWGLSLMKSSLSVQCLNFAGKTKQAFENSNEGLKLAEDCGDFYSKAMAYTAHGYSCFSKGFLEEAETYSLKSIHFCNKVNLKLWAAMSHQNLNDICFDIGDYQKSAHHAMQAISIFGDLKLLPSMLSMASLDLIRAEVMSGEKDIDVTQLIEIVHNIKPKSFEGRIRRSLAAIFLNIAEPRLSEAVEWIKNAIEFDQRNKTAFSLGRDYALYSEIFKCKNNLSQAREYLAKAIDIMRECGADGWVAKYEKALAELV